MTEHEIIWKSQAETQIENLRSFVMISAGDYEINSYVAEEILRQIEAIKESLLKF